MKRIVLCADDYGQEEAVSKGIIELLKAGRITATSCLVTMPGWASHARWLLGYEVQADIGLHLNFTEGYAASSLYREKINDKFMPLSSLLWRTMLRSKLLSRDILIAEINAQVTRFVDALGFLPRFIDGHQHIQHLPLVRDALLKVYEDKFKGEKPYIRSVNMCFSRNDLSVTGFKKAVIMATGGAGFARKLTKAGIPHNTSFSGVYPFANADSYRAYFRQFLTEIKNGGIIMCHPGLSGGQAKDPLLLSRNSEYQYLISREFLKDCDQGGVELVRFKSDQPSAQLA